MNIHFVNDKKVLNKLYRHSLMKKFEDFGCNCNNSSIVDFLKFYIRNLLKHNRTFVISSNLKSNIFVLLLFNCKAVIILNGLGRYKKYKSFRILFLVLLKLNKIKKIILVQNYHDYRYLRRFVDGNFKWIPGSGGTQRQLGAVDEYVVVTRASKFMLQIKSLDKFRQCIHDDQIINIVGCDLADLPKAANRTSCQFHGNLPQLKIFKNCRKFIQLSGYGEGVPHSLVDAICSQMHIYIEKRQFLQFGLHKYQNTYCLLGNGWIEFRPSMQLVHAAQRSCVNAQYFAETRKFYNFWEKICHTQS